MFIITNLSAILFLTIWKESLQGAAIGDPLRWWPDAKLYYEISHEFNSTEVEIIESAFKTFHHHTCFKLIKRSPVNNDYVQIVKHVGCWSQIGRTGGLQFLSLGNECFDKNIRTMVIHNIMHAMGFFHEHARWDRDDYVQIIWENIRNQTSIEANFIKYRLDQLHNLSTPYDYDSLMHFHSTSFGINGSQTIIPKQYGVQIGRQKGLSEIDVQEINLLYKCNDSKPLESLPEGFRWGYQYIRHYQRLSAKNPNECVNRCKEDTNCDAITFYNGTSSFTDNCYLFNSAYNYNSIDDPSYLRGTWKKTRTSIKSKQSNKVYYGIRYINHYHAFHVLNPSECIESCEKNTTCDAISYDSEKNYSIGNCFLHSSISNYTSVMDPTLQWGIWKKNTFQPIRWGIRLKNSYAKTNTKNISPCKKICEKDDRCHAMSFERCETPCNVNCYFFNIADQFTSEDDPSQRWGSWIKF